MTETATPHPADDYSDGPFGGTPKPVITLEVTAATVWEGEYNDGIHPVDVCTACSDPVEEHQYLVRIGGDWMHVDCGQGLIEAASQRELLLTLASHISYNPSKYPAGATRWVLRQLLRIIATQDQRLTATPA